MSSAKSVRLPILLLIGATLLVFWPVLTFELLNWDDLSHIIENPLFHPPRITNIGPYWTRPYFGLYIPLTYTLWTLIGMISMSPAVFHGANLLLHIGCVLMSFDIVRRLVGSNWPAAIGALIFAVHPLQVETVAWVSGFRDLLAALLVLASVRLYMRHVHRGRDGSTSYLLSIACCALAVLSKPNAVVAPLIIIVIARLLDRPWKQLLGEMVPMFVLAIACATWTRLLQESHAQTATTLWWRPLVAADAIVFYLIKLAWPFRLCIDYGRTPQAAMRGWLPWVALPALTALAIVIANGLRRERFLITAALVFLAGLLPVLGLVRFQFQEISTVADHYMYLPMFGVALAVAHLANRFSRRSVWTALCAAIAALAIISAIQTMRWSNSHVLFSYTLRVNPRSSVACNNLAYELVNSNPAAAEKLARRAVELNPKNVDALINLGTTLAMQNNATAAAEQFEHAVALRPDMADAHSNLAGAYGELGRFDDARRECRAALRIDPNHRQARAILSLLGRAATTRAAAAASSTSRSPP